MRLIVRRYNTESPGRAVQPRRRTGNQPEVRNLQPIIVLSSRATLAVAKPPRLDLTGSHYPYHVPILIKMQASRRFGIRIESEDEEMMMTIIVRPH